MLSRTLGSAGRGAALCAMFALAPGADAATASTPGGGALESANGPNGRLIGELIERAHLFEEESLRRPDEDERVELLRGAVTALERVLSLDSHHAEARVSLGRILGSAELGDEALRRSVQELHRARQDDRSGAYDYEIAHILGIVLSRLGRFQEAVNEYDRALVLLPGQPGSPMRLRSHKATILGNSAEALMAMGRLDEAIGRYSQAEAVETTDQAALHALGLAVAYDRDGQLEKSRDALTRSLTTDPGMKLFQSDSVFFVPSGDRSYYVGLLMEAAGDREAALAAWQQFARELPQSRYAERARVHLEELRRTPGLTSSELQRAEVTVGELLFPERPDGRGRDAAAVRQQRSEDGIGRVVQGHNLDLRRCYARALQKDHRLRGEVDVALVIDRSGAVALVETMRTHIYSGERAGDSPADRDTVAGQGGRDLLRCVVDNVRRWRFPAADLDHDELGVPLRFDIGQGLPPGPAQGTPAGPTK